MVAAELQPHDCACMRARTIATRPGTRVKAPGQSNRASRSRSSRGSVTAARASMTTPTGMLIQKTARQVHPWVSSPPTSGPRARKIMEIPA